MIPGGGLGPGPGYGGTGCWLSPPWGLTMGAVPIGMRGMRTALPWGNMGPGGWEKYIMGLPPPPLLKWWKLLAGAKLAGGGKGTFRPTGPLTTGPGPAPEGDPGPLPSIDGCGLIDPGVLSRGGRGPLPSGGGLGKNVPLPWPGTKFISSGRGWGGLKFVACVCWSSSCVLLE